VTPRPVRFRAHCDAPGCEWEAKDAWPSEQSADIDAAAHDAAVHGHAEVRREVNP